MRPSVPPVGDRLAGWGAGNGAAELIAKKSEIHA